MERAFKKTERQCIMDLELELRLKGRYEIGNIVYLPLMSPFYS